MAEGGFWTVRLRGLGHTGWADPVIYAYDQRLRLRALVELLGVGAQQRRALDFGCGVGDFSALLAQRFAAVVAHDISDEVLQRAERLVPAANVSWTRDRERALGAGPFDLVLSITVLQHVTDDAELARLVQGFAAALAPQGRVILLESTGAQDSAPVAYIRRRTAAQLVRAFEAAGLALRRQQAFHHPIDNPTPGFARYRARLDVRLLGRLAAAGLGWAGRRLASLAERAVAQDSDALRAGPGPTQFMVFGLRGKVAHG